MITHMAHYGAECYTVQVVDYHVLFMTRVFKKLVKPLLPKNKKQ